ncbi:MAG: hypothetical protein COZ21_12135, partial [Bacteroidetes bacterium CG_4_10_14_3_um_filter_31_20]
NNNQNPKTKARCHDHLLIMWFRQFNKCRREKIKNIFVFLKKLCLILILISYKKIYGSNY